MLEKNSFVSNYVHNTIQTSFVQYKLLSPFRIGNVIQGVVKTKLFTLAVVSVNTTAHHLPVGHSSHPIKKKNLQTVHEQ